MREGGNEGYREGGKDGWRERENEVGRGVILFIFNYLR